MKKERMKMAAEKAARTHDQHAALCYRSDGGGATEILLVTSRDTGRWVLPKGWPKKSEPGAVAALREASEEAGVQGKASPDAVGLYTYDKLMAGGNVRTCLVSVHAIEVARLMRDFPEMTERSREWFAPSKAAELVQEPELKAILAGFSPAHLREKG